MKIHSTVPAVIALLSCLIIPQTSSPAEPDSIAKGSQIYQEKKCSLCHMIQGTGGKSGGDLSSIGTKRDADWLKRFVTAPKSLVPTAKMPPFKGSADELDALIAYLVSLK